MDFHVSFTEIVSFTWATISGYVIFYWLNIADKNVPKNAEKVAHQAYDDDDSENLIEMDQVDCKQYRKILLYLRILFLFLIYFLDVEFVNYFSNSINVKQ